MDWYTWLALEEHKLRTEDAQRNYEVREALKSSGSGSAIAASLRTFVAGMALALGKRLERWGSVQTMGALQPDESWQTYRLARMELQAAPVPVGAAPETRGPRSPIRPGPAAGRLRFETLFPARIWRCLPIESDENGN